MAYSYPARNRNPESLALAFEETFDPFGEVERTEIRVMRGVAPDEALPFPLVKRREPADFDFPPPPRVSRTRVLLARALFAIIFLGALALLVAAGHIAYSTGTRFLP